MSEAPTVPLTRTETQMRWQRKRMAAWRRTRLVPDNLYSRVEYEAITEAMLRRGWL